MDPLEAIVRAGVGVLLLAALLVFAWIWTDRRR
jgi:hypothetical protein